MVKSTEEQMRWLRKVIGGIVFAEDMHLKRVADKAGISYTTVYRVANKQVKSVQLATYTQMVNGMSRAFPHIVRMIGEPPGPFFEGYKELLR